MRFLVLSEVGVLTEGFPTFVAFVRFLASMNHVMTDERRRPIEGLPTLVTLVSFLSSVNFLMLS